MTHTLENQDALFQVAEVELSYSSKVAAKFRPKICTSADAHRIFTQVWDSGRIELLEEFKMLLLNRANKVIGIVNLSKGGVSGTVVDPKLVFSTALKSVASGLILAHNHPSGNLIPSAADIAITKKLDSAGRLLDIQILDHMIITPESSYHSMKDNGDF